MDLTLNHRKFFTSVVAFFSQLCPDLAWQRQRSQAPEQPASSSIDIESQQPQSLPEEEESTSLLAAAQRRLQWQNAVVAFCFSYVLGVSLQFVGTDDQLNHHQRHHLPFSFALLSFLVLLIFILFLAAFFVHPNCTRTSQALEKIALLLAAAASCHTLSSPFSFGLKCAFWAVFLNIPLLILIIFKIFNPNTN